MQKTLNGVLTMSDVEFQAISHLVYKQFGITLSERKKSLVIARLNKVVRNMGFSTFRQYADWLEHDTTGNALANLANSISTNHSFFFRERQHFDYLLSTVLPEILSALPEQGADGVRVWCAGSAAGEEPYTLAMVLAEYFGEEMFKYNPGILATDISLKALAAGRVGEYPKSRVRDVPETLRKKYFREEKDSVLIEDKLKSLVLFKRLNLIKDTYPFRGKFHVIFCRNVMIYFDKSTRDALIRRFYDCLYDGGYLFIGHSESLDRRTMPFSYVKPAVYKKEH